MAETVVVRAEKHPLAKHLVRHLLLGALLVTSVYSVVTMAQGSPAPSIAGVIGTIEAVTGNSVDLQTKTGVVSLSISQPLTVYHEVPADLSRVTSGSYVGVPSVKQQDGRELAQKIMIFPGELRGAAEGSVVMDAPPGNAARSRMTNGSVSRAATSRMTNGSLEKGSGNTLVVTYEDGAQTISLPSNVPVTAIVPGQLALAKGDTIYAATTTGADGKPSTNRIILIAGAAR
jgi:hypothetical protein